MLNFFQDVLRSRFLNSLSVKGNKDRGRGRGGRRGNVRRRTFESLETRELLAGDIAACYIDEAPLVAETSAVDVARQQEVAILLGEGEGPLQDPPAFTVVTPGADPRLDVSGDGIISPIDALQVINQIIGSNDELFITVEDRDLAPTGVGGSITLEQSEVAVILSPLTDPEGDPLSFFIEETPTNVVIAPLEDGNFRLTATDVLGAQTVRFGASDTAGNIGYTDVTITVVEGDGGGNSDLVGRDQTTITTELNTTVVFKDPFFAYGEETISVRVSSQAAHGTVGILGNGVLNYTPAEGYEGSDQIVLSGTIDQENEVDAVVNFVVGEGTIVVPPVDNPGNDSPVVSGVTSFEGVAGSVIPIINPFTDPDGDTLSTRVKTAPTAGVVGVEGSDFTFTAPAGTYSFDLAASDPMGQDEGIETTATISVVVEEPTVLLPNVGNITRNEAIFVLIELNGGLSGDFIGVQSYQDVPTTSIFHTYVEDAKSRGWLDLIAVGNQFYGDRDFSNGEQGAVMDAIHGNRNGIHDADDQGNLAGPMDWSEFALDSDPFYDVTAEAIFALRDDPRLNLG